MTGVIQGPHPLYGLRGINDQQRMLGVPKVLDLQQMRGIGTRKLNLNFPTSLWTLNGAVAGMSVDFGGARAFTTNGSLARDGCRFSTVNSIGRYHVDVAFADGSSWYNTQYGFAPLGTTCDNDLYSNSTYFLAFNIPASGIVQVYSQGNNIFNVDVGYGSLTGTPTYPLGIDIDMLNKVFWLTNNLFSVEKKFGPFPFSMPQLPPTTLIQFTGSVYTNTVSLWSFCGFNNNPILRPMFTAWAAYGLTV
jgi:hypothetical protein